MSRYVYRHVYSLCMHLGYGVGVAEEMRVFVSGP